MLISKAHPPPPPPSPANPLVSPRRDGDTSLLGLVLCLGRREEVKCSRVSMEMRKPDSQGNKSLFLDEPQVVCLFVCLLKS